MDIEPAQIQASDYSLSKALVDLISGPRFNEAKAFLGYICKLLDLLIAHRQSSGPMPRFKTNSSSFRT